MIVQEQVICKNGVELIKTYSDTNKKIRQVETGIIYDEAIDIPNRFTYEETKEDRPQDEQE